jgi:hypothetical protein
LLIPGLEAYVVDEHRDSVSRDVRCGHVDGLERSKYGSAAAGALNTTAIVGWHSPA